MVARCQRMRPARPPHSRRRFTPIAFGHPYGFYALPVGEGHQVADGPVHRDEFIFDAGPGERKFAFAQAAPKLEGERRDLLRRLHALAIEGIEQLLGTVGGLAEALDHRAQLLRVRPSRASGLASLMACAHSIRSVRWAAPALIVEEIAGRRISASPKSGNPALSD